jgi:hypothetical protein
MILGKLVTLLLFGDFLSTILNRLGARWAADSVLLEQWASKAICLLEKL